MQARCKFQPFTKSPPHTQPEFGTVSRSELSKPRHLTFEIARSSLFLFSKPSRKGKSDSDGVYRHPFTLSSLDIIRHTRTSTTRVSAAYYRQNSISIEGSDGVGSRGLASAVVDNGTNNIDGKDVEHLKNMVAKPASSAGRL